jgi:hypothetical protein
MNKVRNVVQRLKTELSEEHCFLNKSKPWKIRLPLLILHKDLEKSSYRVGSDAVITQDILKNKSEKPVRTTSENIESELADHYVPHHRVVFATRLPGGLNTTLLQLQLQLSPTCSTRPR